MSRAARPLRVALLVETSKAYGRGLLEGIGSYAAKNRSWSLIVEPRDLFSSPPRWLRGWKGDGILARLSNPAIARSVLASGLPVVNLSSALPSLPIPRVELRPDALASLAFGHLRERGFRRFAFLGDDVDFASWSRRVGDSFARIVSRSGLHCEIYRRSRSTQKTRTWEREQSDLAGWLRTLQTPVAVFAITDLRGLRVLDACRQVGLRVPDEVAVLANENDELLCGLATPPLSSIASNTQKMGFEAAQLLDRLMRKAEPSAARIRGFAPVGVVARQSTDVQAHADPIVAAAVRFIREQGCNAISVPLVLAHVGVSRTNLDRRFSAALGCTPHEEIMRVQMQRATELLSRTTMKTLEIAERSGFRHAEYMGVVFKKRLGVTPGEYRKWAAAADGSVRKPIIFTP